MPKRFNPPPGWPAPETPEWLPPVGWEPPKDLPTPPEDWQWFVDEPEPKRRFWDRPLITDVTFVAGLGIATVQGSAWARVRSGLYFVGEEVALLIDVVTFTLFTAAFWILVMSVVRLIFRSSQKLPSRRTDWSAWLRTAINDAFAVQSRTDWSKWLRPGVALTVLIAGTLSIPVVFAATSSSKSPSYSISGTQAGCNRFLVVMEEIISRQPMSDAEAHPILAELRAAAEVNDPLLASDVGDIIEARNATEVSNATQVILRRCLVAGAVTRSELQARLGRIAVN